MCFSDGVSAESQIVGWLESNVGEFAIGEASVCTSFVLAAEFMDTNGQWYSLAVYDKAAPPWRLRGLVDHVMAEIDVEDDEDEED